MSTTLSTHKPVIASAAPARRTGRSMFWLYASAGVLFIVLVVWVAAILFGGGGAETGDIQFYTVARRSFPVVLKEKGELKASKNTDIKCEVEGRSTIISIIPEGTEVEEGTLLVELASEEIDEKVRSEEIKETNAIAALESARKEYEIQLDQNQSDIRKAALAVRLAELELQKYTEGDWVQMLRTAELDLERAIKVRKTKLDEMKADERLHEKGYITQRELDNGIFEHYEADVQVAKAELSLEIIKKFAHPKNLEQKESDVEEARKEHERVKKSAEAKASTKKADLEAKKAELEFIQQRLTKYRDQQKKTKIYAPGPGLVVYNTGDRWDRRQIQEGAEVYERQTIISLPDTSEMVVKVRIHEAKTDRIEIGQRAVVEVEGLPGRQFDGTVSKIAVLADSKNFWLNPELKEYETEISIEKNDENLKPGATAHAEIMVDEFENVLAVPVQAVYSQAGKTYVFVRSEGDIKPAEVELGLASTDFVKIDSGLEEGQCVSLAIDDQMKQMLAIGTEQTN